jgi:hypothetical protein
MVESSAENTFVPKMTECLISVELASAVRTLVHSVSVHVPDGKLGFRCPECGKPVKPHYSAGKELADHFEHLKRNRSCSSSDKRR